jgi:prepilin-type N-terminal cleavage/methylation domain-containing protein
VNRAKGYQGFTLIELMIVVAIIGLLAAIAIPKFANLVIKAKEASIKGKLGCLRSAVSIYYADNEGQWPADPTNCLIVGSRYLDSIPIINIPTTHAHDGPLPQFTIGIFNDNQFNTTSGGPWCFYSSTGRLVVNCSHTDSAGTTWSLW